MDWFGTARFGSGQRNLGLGPGTFAAENAKATKKDHDEDDDEAEREGQALRRSELWRAGRVCLGTGSRYIVTNIAIIGYF